MLSQQSISVVLTKVSCHPPVLIFLVGIPGTSEDVGNPFCLADTSLNQTGAWKRCTLNSRFFRPVVSIPHASPGAKHSSSACLLSHHRNDVMLHLPSFYRSFLAFASFSLRRLFDASTLIVDSSSPCCSYPTPPPCRASAPRWEDRRALRNSLHILMWA